VKKGSWTNLLAHQRYNSSERAGEEGEEGRGGGESDAVDKTFGLRLMLAIVKSSQQKGCRQVVQHKSGRVRILPIHLFVAFGVPATRGPPGSVNMMSNECCDDVSWRRTS
jgi:hypothetical protein